jgi:hypothetical protein
MNETPMSPLHDKATAQAGEGPVAMKTDSPETGPDAKANHTGCSDGIAPLLDLVCEIQRLAKSGGDPGRLWRLRAQFKAERLRQIEAHLQAIDPPPNLESFGQSQQLLAATTQAFAEAVTRTDLTVPEALFLEKSSASTRHQLRDALLAEKEALAEPKRHRKRRVSERRGQLP